MASAWHHLRLIFDIVSIKLFVWIFASLTGFDQPRTLGREGELLDSNLFFFDRYSELADYHRVKGRTAKADKLAAIAEKYYQAAPDDPEPLDAAAMAMPVPRPPVNTSAVSTTLIPRSNGKNASSLVPAAPAPSMIG